MRKVKFVYVQLHIGTDFRIHVPVIYVGEVDGWNKWKVSKFYKADKEVESNWEIYQIQKRKC